jgi:hypothetical protein
MKKTLITLALAFAIIFSGVGTVNAQVDAFEGCRLVREVTVNCAGYDDGFCAGEDGEKTIEEGTEVDENSGGEQWVYICLLNTVNRVAQMIFYAMMIFVIAFVIWGGFTILTSSGNDEKVNKGKGLITYAIIGLIIAMFAYAVPALVRFIL